MAAVGYVDGATPSPRGASEPPTRTDRALPCVFLCFRAARRAAQIWSQYSVVRLVPPLAVLLSLWFLDPPAGLTPTSMHMLAVFVAVIVSFLTGPFTMSVSVRRERCRPPRERTRTRGQLTLGAAAS